MSCRPFASGKLRVLPAKRELPRRPLVAEHVAGRRGLKPVDARAD